MHKKLIYKDLSINEIKKKVKEEGFHPLLITDSKNSVYEKHSHKETKLLAIVEGSMTVFVKENKFELEKGDQLIIPGNMKHSAKMGENGCTYFWSEIIL